MGGKARDTSGESKAGGGRGLELSKGGHTGSLGMLSRPSRQTGPHESSLLGMGSGDRPRLMALGQRSLLGGTHGHGLVQKGLVKGPLAGSEGRGHLLGSRHSGGHAGGHAGRDMGVGMGVTGGSCGGGELQHLLLPHHKRGKLHGGRAVGRHGGPDGRHGAGVLVTGTQVMVEAHTTGHGREHTTSSSSRGGGGGRW